jgi:hypothetical protein
LVEYVLGGAAIVEDGGDDDDSEDVDDEADDIEDVAAYQIRVRDTVDSFLRPATAGSPGVDMAWAVGELDNVLDACSAATRNSAARCWGTSWGTCTASTAWAASATGRRRTRSTSFRR